MNSEKKNKDTKPSSSEEEILSLVSDEEAVIRGSFTRRNWTTCKHRFWERH